MAAHRFVVSIASDGLLARDRVVNTLCFNDTENVITPSDTQALSDDIAELYDTTFALSTRPNEVRVRAYDLDAAPNFPIAESVRNGGAASAATCPREVALCLSFYSEFNRPRRRGRIYVPAFLLESSPGIRPSAATRTKLQGLAEGFRDIGGIDIDWSVWSQADITARKVTHAWINDEWDTQRRRGLRETQRTLVAIDQ